jgi:hypothetical protein
LRVGDRVGIVGLAQAGDEGGVVGRRRDRALLERRQQLTGEGRQRRLARPWQERFARVVDVVDFRGDPLLAGALVRA